MSKLARMLGAVLALMVVAQITVAQTIKEVRQLEGITEYALPNGFSLLLVSDASKPTTTVNLTYRVGSGHEGYGETGAAHLLEHMLFKASATVADPKLEMTRRGARWNGTTRVDRTNYFASFNTDPETLDWMIGWLAEAMTQAKIQKSDLDSEMTVVRNELERAENVPAVVLGSRMVSAAYDWHGYGHHTLGARSDVENISIERLRAFYVRNYRPDNAVLVVGGSFDTAAVLAKVEKAFGPIARPATPIEPAYTVEPAQDGERSVTVRRAGGSTSVAVMYHVMPATSREFAAVAVLAQMLKLDNGPLGEALTRRGTGVAQWAYTLNAREPGYLMAGLTLADNADEAGAAQAAQALVRTMETLQVADAQVQQARTLALKYINDAQRDPEALSLGLSESIACGDWRLWFAMRDWIEGVTPADVRRVAANYFLASNRTLGSYLPAKALPLRAPLPPPVDVAAELADYKGKAVVATAVDFELTPENIEAHTVYRRLTVKGEPGLRLAILPRPTKGDRVSGTLRLHWGTAETMNGQAVLAGMVGPMLMQGTRQRSEDDIAKALLALDARLSIASGAGGLTANFELPAGNMREFDALLSELLHEPSFGEIPFERRHKAMLAIMQNVRSDPAVVADNALQLVFAAPARDQAGRDAGRYAIGDPRTARTQEQSEALARGITAAQLRSFWVRFASAAHGELALVGPVQPDELAAQWQREFGEWEAPEPRRPWFFEWPTDLDRIPPLPPLQVPDKANAAYVARIPLAMDSDDADFPALYAGIQMLGGRPGTALWKRVREEEGLSYGVSSSLFVPAHSSLQPEGRAASISLSASFAPQNREKLQVVVRDEISRRSAHGFSGIEVSFARRAILSARANALAQPANLAGILANNLRYGRDMTRYAQLNAAYDKLDADTVNAALRKYLRVERMVEITAGTFPREREGAGSN
ncbi:M16 family metallopeptidase [Variovorax sp. PBL-E5]|uniref:M16 family metallopeptidase n=1 Tax=Variovorax sp. PBL-E5 TaxID=434014 RepID=UPI0013161837|nr:M16 family metallopeptidase [Variovorax sp. PBL-E5]VTU28394.1 protease3 [Variovorax sp. PBL-E5]